MTEDVLEQQTDQIETYYCEELDTMIAEQNQKEFTNRCKAIETLLKVKNQEEQLKLEREKFEFDKKQQEEQLKLDAEKAANEKAKNEADIKDQKKSFWLGIARILVTIFGTVAGIFLTIWSVVTTMKFEETGSVRSSVGKYALNFCQKTLSKLDKVKAD